MKLYKRESAQKNKVESILKVIVSLYGGSILVNKLCIHK